MAKKRKVRTPKGSEPANGGAADEFKSQISNLKFQIKRESADDKCNRKQTSRPFSFQISNLRFEI